jgi:hypothetical protein
VATPLGIALNVSGLQHADGSLKDEKIQKAISTVAKQIYDFVEVNA